MEIKKTLKTIGLAIAGIVIAIVSWLLNNLFHMKRNYSATKDNELKTDVKESENDLKSDAKKVDQVTSELKETKQEAEKLKEESSSTSDRLDGLEKQGVIKRRKKVEG